MASAERSFEEAVGALAAAYIACAADMTDEFQMVGAALVGSEDKAAVLQEVLDFCVHMFVAVLKPYHALPVSELERRCIGFVGAAEAFPAAVVRGHLSNSEAAVVLEPLIKGGLN